MWRRIKLVKQNDRSDCGAAALATLALFHRHQVGLEKVRDLTATDTTGTSLLGLLKAAESMGFSAKAVRCTNVDALGQVPLPAIAHVQDEGIGHFVVLFRTRRGKVLIGDPVGTLGWESAEEFGRRWSGNLLLAWPSSLANHQAPPTSSSFGRFLRLLAPHRGVLLEVVACALLMAVLAISTSYFVQHLVDSVLVRDERPLLNALGIGMVLVVLFRTGFDLVRQYLLAYISRKIDLSLLAGYAEHVLRLPLRFFESRRVGEIYSRVTDIAKLRDAIQGAAVTAIVDGIVVVAMFGVLWTYDARLAGVATLVAPLFLLAVGLHHPSARRRSQQAMEDGAQLSAHLIEDFSGIETFKAFHAESQRLAKGERRVVSFAQSLFRLHQLDIQLGSLVSLISGLAGLAVLWYGGHRVMDGALSIGQLLFFYTLLATMLDPLARLATVNLKLQDAMVAVDRLYQVLEIDQEPWNGDKASFEQLEHGIHLQNVDFGYGARGPVLRDVSMTIPRGSVVAIVGESGSGKSTLLKLLLNYYQPTGGRILIDGTDLRDIQMGAYRQRLGVVAQDPFIFNGTIRENISLARPTARLEEIIDVARAAGLEEFINSLPDRFESAIGERGANLSGGQRQRLAIARALLHRPELLVFDEATSQLDTATEELIQRSLKDRLTDKTVVVVAHRLSTVKGADTIYVMHQGCIVEQGTHAELIAHDGRYARLWRAQTGSDGGGHVHNRIRSLASQVALVNGNAH
jgi:ATP-binding cassette subfamily B protein